MSPFSQKGAFYCFHFSFFTSSSASCLVEGFRDSGSKGFFRQSFRDSGKISVVAKHELSWKSYAAEVIDVYWRSAGAEVDKREIPKGRERRKWNGEKWISFEILKNENFSVSEKQKFKNRTFLASFENFIYRHFIISYLMTVAVFASSRLTI